MYLSSLSFVCLLDFVGVLFRCSLDENRACSPCRECPSGQYGSTPCQQSSNRICSNCLACTTSQYVSKNCSQEDNRACTAISPLCAPGSYEQKSPSTYSDRHCEACELSVTYQDLADEKTCKSASECGPGLILKAPPTITSDRECKAVPSGYFKAGTGDAGQVAYKECTDDEYEEKSGTSSTDRQCATVTICKEAQTFMTVEATSSSNRQCQFCTVCPNHHVQLEACNATSDTKCQG